MKELGKKFEKLYDVIKRLRDPKDGCPWDIKQTHQSIRENFIEETYEAIEAIDNNDEESLKEELGDVLLHVLFHSDISERGDSFDIGDVIDGITQKLIRRHPHVFSDTTVSGTEEVLKNWEIIKKEEKSEKQNKGVDKISLLDGIPMNMPALITAQRIQQRAARIGFDWDSPEPVWDKIYEELDELRDNTLSHEQIEEELGDVIFSLTNLSRFLDVNAEMALRSTIRKFDRRFRHVESRLFENNIKDPSLETMDSFWDEAKRLEKKKPLS